MFQLSAAGRIPKFITVLIAVMVGFGLLFAAADTASAAKKPGKPKNVKVRQLKMAYAKKTCFVRATWKPVRGADGYQYVYKGKNNARGAVDWAVRIAANDSFTYGEKPRTSRAGCYFCGTTKLTKPKGYEKTYVCCTFITAAFAHGANDPAIMQICKNCRTLGGTADTTVPENFTRTGVFKEVHPTMDELKIGDVFLFAKGSANHVSMYVGNGQYVEATSQYGAWTPESIAVRPLTESAFNVLTNRGIVRYKGKTRKTNVSFTKKTHSRMISHKIGKKAKMRVRAYRIVNGHRVYGKWSKWVTIRTK